MIDIEKIREYTGADDEFIATLFEKSLSSLDENLNEIRSHAEARDWPGLRKKVHMMLSSARIFFLDEIVELSKEIEAQIEEGNYEGLQAKTERLLQLYANYRKAANDWLASQV